MNMEELTEYIERKLYENGINIKTQDEVIKYVYVNQKLFGNIININELIDRIINNLKHDIMSIDSEKKGIAKVLKARALNYNGMWIPNENKIIINPIKKALSFVHKKTQLRQESTIMHELDHCATTQYTQISQKEKNEFIDEFLKDNKIEEESEARDFKDFLNEQYEASNGIWARVGVYDFGYCLKNDIDLTEFNEGITAYKQEMYNKFFNNKTKTSYDRGKKVAKFVSDIIGKEELVKNHFNNNYEQIKVLFQEKTGKNLNDLIKELNKEPSNKLIRRIPYIRKMYNTVFYKKQAKKIDQFMNEAKQENQHKPSRNAEFIPKYTINYEEIKSRMDNNSKDNRKENVNENIR